MHRVCILRDDSIFVYSCGPDVRSYTWMVLPRTPWRDSASMCVNNTNGLYCVGHNAGARCCLGVGANSKQVPHWQGTGQVTGAPASMAGNEEAEQTASLCAWYTRECA